MAAVLSPPEAAPAGEIRGPCRGTSRLGNPAPLAPMPAPIQNFAGLSFADSCAGGQCGDGWPPDTNGDVGPNHYIQAVNSAYAIYSKTGTLLAAFTENQLWSTGGTNPCNGNSQGDPVVLYDQLADRWILTHIAFAVADSAPVPPFYQCIAASKTGDPVAGGWWLYALRMDPGGPGLPLQGSLNDYPKFGIWPDCLYMAANEFLSTWLGFFFIGTAFASFSRSDLYSGAPLTWALGFIDSTRDPFTMIPSNLRGRLPSQLPAPGTPNYFVSESQTQYAFEVRKFTAGPNCGSGGTLSAPTNVSQAFYYMSYGDSVPQPGTTNKLDAIDDRLMQKVQYRKVGPAESLWVVHNVGTSPVTLQWGQLDVPGGVISTTPVQQQIYAPDTTLYRWMGSLAVDNDGNMALGYSTSNGTAPNYPSIAYAGRLVTDPFNTLPQTEVKLIAGAGSQTNNCGGAPCHRWGDYTAMSVDPVDDCTFWYTNEYYSSAANGASGNWQTRIGSFKFPSCTPPLPVHRDFNGDRRSDILLLHTSGLLYEWLLDGATVIGQGAISGIGTTWRVVGVGDFNGDGKADILLQHTSGALYMWLLNGTTVIGQGIVGGLGTTWTVVGVGDFNGDGKADILLQHFSILLYEWPLNGATVIGQGAISGIGTAWKVVEVGDFNGAGTYTASMT